MEFRKIRAWSIKEKQYYYQEPKETYFAFIKKLQAIELFTKLIIEESIGREIQGIELYVGDVIDFQLHEVTMMAEVVYSKDSFCYALRLLQNNGLMDMKNFQYPITLLGNIHEKKWI